MNEMRVRLEAREPRSGEIRALWFSLPVNEDELEEKLGIDSADGCFIVDKELPFGDEVQEDTTVEKLNDLYSTYESLPSDLKEDYAELMCYFSNLDELHRYRHDIIHYSWCKNMTDVARHLLENDPSFSSLSESVIRYFDFEAYGQYLDDNGRFVETDHGIYELPYERGVAEWLRICVCISLILASTMRVNL